MVSCVPPGILNISLLAWGQGTKGEPPLTQIIKSRQWCWPHSHTATELCSVVLRFGINQTNPSINLRLLLDNTNIPFRVIQANAPRMGAPSGWKADLLPAPTRLHENTHMGTAPGTHPRCLFPTAPEASARIASGKGENGRMGGQGLDSLPPLPSSATDLIFRKRGFFFPFWCCLFVNHATPACTWLKAGRARR